MPKTWTEIKIILSVDELDIVFTDSCGTSIRNFPGNVDVKPGQVWELTLTETDPDTPGVYPMGCVQSVRLISE